MKEIKGELWDYLDHVVCITTNGFVKKNGEAVMGRGCALEATKLIPGIAAKLGTKIRECGNVVQWLGTNLITFPVKHNWWEEADLNLIRRSALDLSVIATNFSSRNFVLPRPGCGNGRRDWPTVKRVLDEVGLPDNVWVISR